MFEIIGQFYSILLLLILGLLTLGYWKRSKPLKLGGALLLIILGFELGLENNILVFLAMGATSALIIFDVYGN